MEWFVTLNCLLRVNLARGIVWFDRPITFEVQRTASVGRARIRRWTEGSREPASTNTSGRRLLASPQVNASVSRKSPDSCQVSEILSLRSQAGRPGRSVGPEIGVKPHPLLSCGAGCSFAQANETLPFQIVNKTAFATTADAACSIWKSRRRCSRSKQQRLTPSSLWAGELRNRRIGPFQIKILIGKGRSLRFFHSAQVWIQATHFDVTAGSDIVLRSLRLAPSLSRLHPDGTECTAESDSFPEPPNPTDNCSAELSVEPVPSVPVSESDVVEVVEQDYHNRAEQEKQRAHRNAGDLPFRHRGEGVNIAFAIRLGHPDDGEIFGFDSGNQWLRAVKEQAPNLANGLCEWAAASLAPRTVRKVVNTTFFDKIRILTTRTRGHCKSCTVWKSKKKKEWDGNLMEERKKLYVPRKKEKKEKKIRLLIFNLSWIWNEKKSIFILEKSKKL